MQRMVTNKRQVARRDMRIGSALWLFRKRLTGRIPDYRHHSMLRGATAHNGYSRFTSRYVGRRKYDLRRDCAELVDRLVKRRLLARCQKYAWPGGYLIVAITRDNNKLCPQCAATNDRDNPDDRIVERTTIEYVTDGWTPDDEEYIPALCDGCQKDMGEM